MMGHFTTREYAPFFSQGVWGILKALGYDPDVMVAQGYGFADVQYLTKFYRELHAGDEIFVMSTVKKLGNSSLTSQHLLYNAATKAVCAEFEAVSVQFDLRARAKIPLLDVVRSRAAEAGVPA